ncbi:MULTISPECIES: tellurite resistance TerB family protein [unclassified Mesorhizobium]|uniref:tellurite resistance TerB family protein n=1 Tax=unclassified Mesorhizobium TaxID=325217 RepID=UPI003014AC8E
MFERVLSFLKDLPGGMPGAAAAREDDPRVAAAALLYHAMDADGVRQDVEWERLKQLLSEAYGVTGSELAALVAAGEKADNEAVDLYAFTSVLKRHLDEPARIDFIRLMWEIVYADGELHELEDNTLWRVAELIGVDRRDRIAMRQAVARSMPDAKGGSSDE